MFNCMVFVGLNLLNNEVQPDSGCYSLEDARETDGPPETGDAHAERCKKQGKGNAHHIEHNADGGGRNGAADAVEESLRGDFVGHEDHRKGVDAEVVSAGLVGFGLGYDEREDLVAEEVETDGAHHTKHGDHLKGGEVAFAHAVELLGGVVLGGEGAQSCAESLGCVPCQGFELAACSEGHHTQVSALCRGNTGQKEADEREEGVEHAHGQTETYDAAHVVGLELAQKELEAVEDGVALLEHVDKQKAHEHLRQEGGKGCTVGAEMAEVDEYRIEHHIGDETGSVDPERHFGVAGGIVDAGHGRGQEEERKGHADDVEIAGGELRHIVRQSEQTDQGGGKREEQKCPHQGNADGQGEVVLGKTAGTLQIVHADALTYGDFGAYFVEQGNGVGGPGEYSHGTNRSHGLTAKSAYPCHIGEAVGHLYERGSHDGKGQVKELTLDWPGCEILDILHNGCEFTHKL